MSLIRQLTRTNQAPPSMLGPARTSSPTGTDLQCSATTCGPPAHQTNSLKEQVPAPSSLFPLTLIRPLTRTNMATPSLLGPASGPTVPSLCLRRTGPPGQRPQGTSTSSKFMSLAPLNRHLTRTNTVQPPMLGPARTPSLTRTDLQCSATACSPHGHPNNGLKEQVPAPSSCPIDTQPAPDSASLGHAHAARTGPPSLTGMDLRCPASAYASPDHSDKGPKEP